jgi:hypothetical protein
MNDSLDIIDEKLAELKESKEAPQYGGILESFEWTREWFANVGEVLLTLAYRGDSDRPILDFIRAKITDMDVVSFNRILQGFGVEPIKNHYDIITKENPKTINFLYNDNDAMVDYIIKHCISCDGGAILSRNLNGRVLEFLIEQIPSKINWTWFYANKSDVAVDYILSNQNREILGTIALNTNDRIVNYLIAENYSTLIFENSNDLVVDYIFTQIAAGIVPPPEIISRNKNDRIVRYLLDNPKYIDKHSFGWNSNDLAVDHILSNVHDYEIHRINQNINPKISKFLIEHPEHINISKFLQRKDDLAVDYILNNMAPNRLNKYICLNSNDRIIEYIMQHPEIIDIPFISENNCNYNWQKIDKFNKLKLFENIPHMEL